MPIKVHYFDAYGKAEALRMLLAHAKLEFENVHYTHATLPEAKDSGNLEFGQLPVLEIDGKFFAQSQATLRMLGKQHGYYPADAYEAWRVDSILDAINDLSNSMAKAFYTADEEAKKAEFAKIYTEVLPKWLFVINKRVESNSDHKHIVGDKLTIADMALASLAYSTFLNDLSLYKQPLLEQVEKFPVLLAYFVRLGDNFKEHLATRNKTPM